MTEIKKRQITISGNNPLEIVDVLENGTSDLSETQQLIVQQLGKTFRAYITAIKELLSGKYAHLKDWAPLYLSEPGHILIAACPDGVVLRFERKQNKEDIVAGWFPSDLSTITPILSQGLIHC